ncbi:cytochrome b-c1 complex subunit 9 [Conger conger]|uniref:cytochrome b-c1 complex subunit 9 n=1 Tax=Conger conger TaxID=82655 RepID=UPI002A59E780|nr:cytochrome b-c1 complex subunit 9 [Conger conger]
MAITGAVYNLLFRRTSTFAITIMVGAVFFERMFDQGGDAIFEEINRGKLWKHIKHRYENTEDADE